MLASAADVAWSIDSAHPGSWRLIRFEMTRMATYAGLLSPNRTRLSRIGGSSGQQTSPALTKTDVFLVPGSKAKEPINKDAADSPAQRLMS